MSKRTLRAEDVDGFMAAIWDEIVDTEVIYQVTILMDVRRGKKRGELSFHAHAYRESPDNAEWLIARSEAHWPSHKYTSLHAMLLNLVSRLNIEVQKDYRERTGTYYSSPVD